jgi:hypothetical protein
MPIKDHGVPHNSHSLFGDPEYIMWDFDIEPKKCRPYMTFSAVNFGSEDLVTKNEELRIFMFTCGGPDYSNLGPHKLEVTAYTWEN